MKKVLLIFIVAILLVSSVSAWEFDNVKRFENSGKYGKIKIINAFGLGSDIAEYELTENTDQCLIDCRARGRVNMGDSGQLFTDMKFINNRGQNKELPYTIYIKETVDYVREEPIMKQVCTINESKNMDCVYENDGVTKYNEKRDVWNVYDNRILEPGEYEWEIRGKKQRLQNIDWIGESFGEELSSWAWWNGDWGKKKEINITGGTNETLTDFTVFINVTYDVDMQSDFDDIRFTNSSENEELDYEIGYKVNSVVAGFWVRIPNLVPGINTIYMYYSNAGASSTSDGPATWDDDYIGVYHLDGDFIDSTGINNGSAQGSPTSNTTNCMFGSCYTFRVSGTTGDCIKLTTAYSGLPSYTLEGFGFLTKVSDSNKALLGNVDPSVSWETFVAQGTDDIRAIYWDAGSALKDAVYANSFPLNHYKYFGSSALPAVRNYVNETYYTEDAIASTKASNGGFGYLGCVEATGSSNIIYQWDGELDEVRVSNVTRSTSWMNRSYNNFDTSLTSFGAEEAGNSLAITLNSPVDYLNSTTESVSLNCTSTDETGVINITLLVNGIDNVTVDDGGAGNLNLSLETTIAFPEGLNNWTCRATDGTGGTGDPITATVRHLTVDTIDPFVIIETPDLGYNQSNFTLPIVVTFNITATDTNRDKCYYNTSDASGLNVVTCSDIFNISFSSPGAKTIFVYANDTFGNENMTSVNISLYLFTITQTEAVDPITEGSNNNITVIVNVTGPYVVPVTALLTWNNSLFPASIISNGNITTFYNLSSITSGLGNRTGNTISWSWEINSTNVLNKTNTTVQTQKVLSFTLDGCISGTVIFLNYSVFAEEDRTLLNTTLENVTIDVDLSITNIETNVAFNFSTRNESNPYQICVNADVLNGTDYRLDVETQYDADRRDKEFHNIQNFTLNNNTIPQNINLYDVLTADSEVFQITYKDDNLLPVENALIDVTRKYMQTGTFISVEVPKTDTDGQTVAHLIENEVIYTFIIKKAGTILATFSNYLVKCDDQSKGDCSINLNAFSTGEESTDFITVDDVIYTLTADESARTITAVFTTSSGASTTFELDGVKFDSFGNDTICEESSTSSSGTLTCSVPASYGNVTVVTTITKDSKILGTTIFEFFTNPSEIFGGMQSILLLIMLVTLPMLFISHPIGPVLGGMIALITAGLLNIYDGGSIIGIAGTTGWAIIAGGILIWRISNRN